MHVWDAALQAHHFIVGDKAECLTLILAANKNTL